MTMQPISPQRSAPKAAPPKAPGKTTGKARRNAARAPKGPPLVQRLRERVKAFRPRVLPVTIFVAVLMLGVRVGDLWRLATHDAHLPEFPVSLAQGSQPDGKAGAGAKGAPGKASPAPGAPMQQVAAAGEPPKGGASEKPPAPAGTGGAAGDKAGMDNVGVGDTELLKHYADRRAELERRTREVEQREALLTAAEKRIEQKLTEMEKVRADIQKMMRTGDEKQSAQLESLVKIYETMKPKEAARIFEELDMPVLLDVIQRMKETKTAPILAAMEPTKAKEVTTALVERRALPAVPSAEAK